MGDTSKTGDAAGGAYRATPRHVHHDATMFRMPNAEESLIGERGPDRLSPAFGTDTNLQRRAEEMQRVIEFNAILHRDALVAARNSKITMAIDAASLGLACMLMRFGFKYADPRQSLMRRFAESQPMLARAGSPYTLAGWFGVCMAAVNLPMEWTAIGNTRTAVQQLEESQARTIEARNALFAQSGGFKPPAAEGAGVTGQVAGK